MTSDSSNSSSMTKPERDGADGELHPSVPPLSPSLPLASSRLTAALQIVAGHLIIFNTFGYIGSWGFFEAYYMDALGRSFLDISWVGSLQIFLVFFIGAVSGRALDAGFLRATLIAGCALQVVGIFATSWSHSYWQLFLAQGVCVGLGDGLVFCPIISLISTYYDDRSRTLAVSFAATGAATGGMVFPAIAKQLLPTIGIAWTLRVMGFVFLANAAIAIALVRVSVQPRKSGPLFEWSAFREIPFCLYSIGTFLALWGIYFAYYYVSALSHLCALSRTNST
jgi:MFS family permease